MKLTCTESYRLDTENTEEEIILRLLKMHPVETKVSVYENKDFIGLRITLLKCDIKQLTTGNDDDGEDG